MKVVHSGARARVLDDLELMHALAGYVESHDETLAAYSPRVVVDEFDTMMRAAVDLRQELANLQQFTANFADEPDIVIPTPYADLCGPDMLTMSLVTGQRITGRDSVTAAGWDVDELVRRASNVYLEMVFRDGIYHADPHPGNFLLPDGQHLAILDFGDVGRLTGARKAPARGHAARRRFPGCRRADRHRHRPHPRSGRPRHRQAERSDRHLAQPIPRRQHRRSRHGRGDQCRHADHAQQPADVPRRPRIVVPSPSPPAGCRQGIWAQVSLTELLQPYLRKMAAERLDPRAVGRQAVRNLRSWQRVLADAPRTIRPLLQQLKDGTVHVELEIHDGDGAADRLTDGLLGSASLLASAQLLSRGTGPRIGPVSAPGAIALAVGILTWRRLVPRSRRLPEPLDPCSAADPAGP